MRSRYQSNNQKIHYSDERRDEGNLRARNNGNERSKGLKSSSESVCEILVNGRSYSVPANQTVRDLLSFLEIKADRVAVEFNRAIVHQRAWAATRIDPGAQLEIVEFVGGG